MKKAIVFSDPRETGHLRGGLSIAAVLASGIFGSTSGSGSATLTCIGGIMMPHLRRAKYPEGLSAALIVNASPLGMLIPPSSSHTLYAWVSQTSVLKAFLSTVIPGIILITLLCVVNQIQLRKYKGLELSSASLQPQITVKTSAAGTATYCAKAPSKSDPIQMLSIRSNPCSRMQALTMARLPIRAPSTPSPTETTSPQQSVP